VCLILLAHCAHPRYRLIVAANRDEWFRRPSAPAAFWKDRPDLLAGRDLEQGGTWLGITRGGRFAALTNFRDPRSKRDDSPSRGELVADFLSGRAPAVQHARALLAEAPRYNGFNLLASDGAELAYVCSRTAQSQIVAPGIHGLSNGVLDEPWPKVRRGCERLAAAIDRDFSADDLFALLRDDALAPEAELPSTGVSTEWERLLSAMHIVADGYGTRCATVVLVEQTGDVTFLERTFDPTGRAADTVEHRFSVQPR
jgi:uncharacterized protein with NRDE domain